MPYLILLALLMPLKGFSQEQAQHTSLSIGLLVPDQSHTHVIRAAEMAIELANKEGGYRNHPFELVVRTTEGPWGAGSKESVSLVYEDNVRAFVGSLDGRNGHLAEQVAAKSHLSYLESFTTDPTLSQAFVPWFMRVVPNDDQQAATLLKLIKQNGGGSIGILSTENYGARYAVRSLTKAVARETGSAPLVIPLDSLGKQQKGITEKILSSQIDHLVLPFDAPFLTDLIVSLGKRMPSLKIYGTLHFTLGAENRLIPWSLYEGMCMIAPVHLTKGGETSLSDSRSAYTFDAVNMVIRAIQQAGTEREAIRDYLSHMEYEGITGPISFDASGNRIGQPVLIRIENGQPTILEIP